MVGALAPTNGSAGPISSYTLDGDSPVVFTAPDNLTETEYSQTFFLQQSLSASQEHTIVINVTRASVATPFLFDYIGYIPLASAAPNASMTSVMPPPSYTGVVDDDNLNKSSTPVGAIVGGVVGGVAVLVAVVLGLLFFCRKRKNARSRIYRTAVDSALLEQGRLLTEQAHSYLAC